jgi:hypothetical protein
MLTSLRISADRVANRAAQTRAQAAVLDLQRPGLCEKRTLRWREKDSNPGSPVRRATLFESARLLTNKAGLKIVVQRSWTDRHDCLAASLGTMYLISEGRQRGATRKLFYKRTMQGD